MRTIDFGTAQAEGTVKLPSLAEHDLQKPRVFLCCAVRSLLRQEHLGPDIDGGGLKVVFHKRSPDGKRWLSALLKWWIDGVCDPLRRIIQRGCGDDREHKPDDHRNHQRNA